MKANQRPLLARFKELAPAREPISIQRWSARRIATGAAAASGGSCSWLCSWTPSEQGSTDGLPGQLAGQSWLSVDLRFVAAVPTPASAVPIWVADPARLLELTPCTADCS